MTNPFSKYTNIIAASLLLFNGSLFASTPQLVKDINTRFSSALNELCSSVVEYQGDYYFCANSNFGQELWKVDENLENPEMVSDINSGPESSNPRELVVFKNLLYFVVDQSIYKTDGSSANTESVFSISSPFPGGTNNNIGGLRVHNGQLIFRAASESALFWTTDGTTVQPLSTKISPSIDTILDATTIGQKLFFSARTDETGIELWVTEGTPSTTRMVKDITPGQASSRIGTINSVDTYVAFTATINGVPNIWVSDGTEDGTYAVTDSENSAISRFCNGKIAAIGSTLIFCADDDGDAGEELWSTDGITGSEQLLKDINDGLGNATPRNFSASANRVYFFARSSGFDDQLWSSDGTESGTQQATTKSRGNNQVPLMIKDGNFIFVDDTSNQGLSLWELKSNQTEANLIVDFDNNNASTSISKGRLYGTNNRVAYFQPNRSDPTTWKTDGTTAGTSNLDSFIEPGTFNGSRQSITSPITFSLENDNAFFLNLDPNIDAIRRGWVHDGSSTRVFIEIFTEADIVTRSAIIGPLIEFKGALYFTAYDGVEDRLWTTDGTQLGTQSIASIDSKCGSFFGSTTEIVKTEEYFYFFCDGLTLWRSDGSTSGTVELGQVGSSGFGFSQTTRAARLTPIGNTVYFIGYDSTNGRELWKTEGSPETTSLVKDIKPGSGSGFLSEERDNIADLSNMAVLNGVLYFTADDGLHGPELWMSDGTAKNTTILKDIFELENTGSFPQDITRVGDTLFFSAFTLELGYELWKSDGSEQGTQLVKNIEPSTFTIQELRFTCELVGFIEFCTNRLVDVVQPNSSLPLGIVDYNGTAVFRAYTKQHGYELWASDGTSSGTRLIKDLLAGPESGFNLPAPPDDLDFETNYPLLKQLSDVGLHNNQLYLSANSDRGFTELWKTDLSNEGTILVEEISNSNASARMIESISETQPNDNILYFSAPNQDTPQTLWHRNDYDNDTRVTEGALQTEISNVSIKIFHNDQLYFTATSNNQKGLELYVLTPDSDRDGIDDPNDNCARIANSLQNNFDDDLLGDACDSDDDNDGVDDTEDAFSLNPFETRDNDNDGMGDNSDPDDDNDLVNDRDEFGEPLDNCQFVDNPDQTDTDMDGVGDACEASQLCFPVITRESKVSLICL